MMDVSVKIQDKASKNLRYAQKHLAGWLSSAVGDKAHEYRDFVKSTFNQYLTNRTGKTVDSIQAWMPKKNRRRNKSEWLIRPGVEIPGMLNYLFIWCGTSKDFMNGSFSAWKPGANVVEYAAKRIEERFNNLKG